MSGFENANTGNRVFYVTAFLLLLTTAFLQAFKATHDLTWYCNGDFNRDMAFAQGFLNDGFGTDPNFPGQFVWYNPLITIIEALISRVTGLPLNIVLARAGAYLNLLCPAAFFVMMYRLAGWKRALAGAASYIFLASGMLPPFFTATYSPWAFPDCFTQCIFFLNILLVYRSYQTGYLRWFALLGFMLGLCFLGHTSPTLILLLIMISLHVARFFRMRREKNYEGLRLLLLQGIVAFIPFIIVSFPFLYYIVGKYHLYARNREPFEYVTFIFIWRNWRGMIHENLSIFLAISAVGFFWFLRNEKNQLLRRILINWLVIGVLMYIYSSVIAGLNKHFDIQLPGTVPSFHYFVYLKALQSVFFGYGFLFLAGRLIDRIQPTFLNRPYYSDLAFILLAGLVVAAWFPRYVQRPDFVQLRAVAQDFGRDSARIGVYQYILNHVNPGKVILCGEHASVFPVMPTARKMVSIGITYSNPYLEFTQRETDRNNMMHFLEKGAPLSAAPLVDEYKVDYVLVENDSMLNKTLLSPRLNNKVYENPMFTLFAIDR